MRLKGKVAVVTGGTKGLGRCIAEAYLAEGANVVIAARDENSARPVLDIGGDNVAFYPVDVRTSDSVSELSAHAAEHFGGLDIMVANAGVSRPGRAAELATEDWQETVTTNFTGTFHCVQSAVPYLRESHAGRIITMSSALGSRVAPGGSAYCATKAGVEMLTKVVAVELAEEGITVNCLSPGLIDEGMGNLLKNSPVWEKYSPKLASGRLGRPEEVADAAVFLASDESTYVNGHVLEVNGGLVW